MPQFTRLLHPTDFSDASNAALEYALDLAAAAGAALHVVHVVPATQGYADSEERRRKRDDELRQRMTQLVEERKKASEAPDRRDVPVDVAVIQEDKAAEGVLRYAANHDIDLIVPGTHGRRGVRHLILGSVMESIVRKSSIPVLSVRPQQQRAARRLQHVLTPIDFSDFSKSALHYAKYVASLADARVSLLFVVEERTVPLFSDTGIPNFTVLKMEDDVVENAPAALKAVDNEVQVDSVQTEYLIREGYVDETIVDVAEKEGAGLIVMGAHGLGSSERRALGNTTAHVIRTSSIPVLVVPDQLAARERK